MSDKLADLRAKAATVTAELRAAGWKPAANPAERYARRPTLKNAVAAFCYQCMGCEASYRADIRDCTAPRCPLYLYRPYQPNDD